MNVESSKYIDAPRRFGGFTAQDIGTAFIFAVFGILFVAVPASIFGALIGLCLSQMVHSQEQAEFS